MASTGDDWSEDEIKRHYRDNYLYDPVKQWREGNRFEKLWFRQRIRRIARVMRKMPFSAGGRDKAAYWILDVGGGTGAISSALSEMFPMTNTLITDISPKLIKKASEYHREKKNIHLAVADAFNLPLADGTVAVALMTEMLEHVKHPEDAVREVRRVLKPSGLLVITVPYKYHPLWHFSFLRRIFSSGYAKEEGRYEPFHNYFSLRDLREIVEPQGFKYHSHTFAGFGITLLAFFTAVDRGEES